MTVIVDPRPVRVSKTEAVRAAAVAWSNNFRHDLTGCLCPLPTSFVQYTDSCALYVASDSVHTTRTHIIYWGAFAPEMDVHALNLSRAWILSSIDVYARIARQQGERAAQRHLRLIA